MTFSCFGGSVSLREEGNAVESDGTGELLGGFQTFSDIAYRECKNDFKCTKHGWKWWLIEILSTKIIKTQLHSQKTRNIMQGQSILIFNMYHFIWKYVEKDKIILERPNKNQQSYLGYNSEWIAIDFNEVAMSIFNIIWQRLLNNYLDRIIINYPL